MGYHKQKRVYEKKPSNYPSFRHYLHWDFDEKTISDRDTLSRLMKWKEYHLTGSKKKGTEKYNNPTSKQLDFAWKEIVNKYWVYEKYKKHFVARAMTEVIYSGKVYRKGQFLPEGALNV